MRSIMILLLCGFTFAANAQQLHLPRGWRHNMHEGLLSPADRVLIAQATGPTTRLGRNAMQGAPLVLEDIPIIEAALKASGTPASLALIAKIAASNPPTGLIQ